MKWKGSFDTSEEVRQHAQNRVMHLSTEPEGISWDLGKWLPEKG